MSKTLSELAKDWVKNEEEIECPACGKKAKVMTLENQMSRRWVFLPPGWVPDLGLDDSGQAACSEACARESID